MAALWDARVDDREGVAIGIGDQQPFTPDGHAGWVQARSMLSVTLNEARSTTETVPVEVEPVG